MDTKTNMGFESRRVSLNMFKLKSKILVLGMLCMLLFSGIGMVEASTISSNNQNPDCTADHLDEEFNMTDEVWARIIMDYDVPVTNGIIWVCPCSWDGEFMSNSTTGCVRMVTEIVIPVGYGEQTICKKVGIGSQMPNVSDCKCYDMIFDYNGNGKYMGYDSIDEMGVVNCTVNCVSDRGEAGFHIFPEVPTIVLFLSGLVLLFGYTMVVHRRRRELNFNK